MEKRCFRLILVDDEPMILKGLKELFPWAEWGFTVVSSYGDGKQALEALRLKQADVVLTDIRMPVLDGLTLARRIGQEGIKAAVIFLSAHADFEYARKGLTYGVKGFILKPVRQQELKEIFLKLYEQLALEAEPMDASLVDTVKKYISQHLRDATVYDAAKDMGISQQTLSRSYKRAAGESFANTLNKARMDMAGNLILALNMRLYNVAQELGYDNAKNFSRAFHNHYGMTPSEYRKRYMDTH